MNARNIRFIQTPDGEDGLNYLCAGYRKFFNHIDPYMKFMVNELKKERAPANVMKWVKEKDAGFPSFNVGRNDLCPCGSGKKFKLCCRK
ncbi:MAG: SEC-C metal-binding domain-containing protein [Melioribacteraceae bacterium]|nr:SEC-C metal-binding domain-containing protein [Melioribacteraceae bacterium]